MDKVLLIESNFSCGITKPCFYGGGRLVSGSFKRISLYMMCIKRGSQKCTQQK